MTGVPTVAAGTGSMTVVSDTTVLVTKGNVVGNAVEAWEPFLDDPNPADPNNSVWDIQTGNFFTGSGADWIWESYRTVNPIDGDIVYFEKTFNIPGDPTSGTLYITCDNGYEVYLNGTPVGSAQLGVGWEASNLFQTYVDSNNWQSVESYDVFSKLVPGTNVLLIKAANEYSGPPDGQSDGTTYTNPAGLIFQLDIDYEDIGFTYTWGYWKTHSTYGPAPYDNTWALLGENTTFFLSGQSYYEVLSTSVAGGNAYYQLAHQYIAAKLNKLDGAWMRADVQAAFNAATGLLNVYTPAEVMGFKKGNPAQKLIFAQFNSLAGILDNYNNGLMGTPHAP
jgi:hypothetical protein